MGKDLEQMRWSHPARWKKIRGPSSGGILQRVRRIGAVVQPEWIQERCRAASALPPSTIFNVTALIFVSSNDQLGRQSDLVTARFKAECRSRMRRAHHRQSVLPPARSGMSRKAISGERQCDHVRGVWWMLDREQVLSVSRRIWVFAFRRTESLLHQSFAPINSITKSSN
ncbi:hypothetical protein [Bradyrhizobium zhanjiangense]|uniref:hypothetical protein n=1 Tax=Bradyrhizobium zhanjiangense TaxID=1325107 RepID=UPI001ABFC5CC|nr:hypothetical protein [Bradyrhizobium zhanjiangense]